MLCLVLEKRREKEKKNKCKKEKVYINKDKSNYL